MSDRQARNHRCTGDELCPCRLEIVMTALETDVREHYSVELLVDRILWREARP